MKAQNKAQKGTVDIEEHEGRLRLRWSYGGKRFSLSLGLPNTKLNQKAAQQKATQIELDIAQYGSVKARIAVKWALFPKMEIKHGASQRILISVSQDTKYGDIQSDRGSYPSNFNRTSDR